MEIAYATIEAKVIFKNISGGFSVVPISYKTVKPNLKREYRISEILQKVSPYIRKNYTDITFSISDPIYKG